MIGSEASFRPDGSCRLTGETDVKWTSVSQWAIAWFAEQRAHQYGDACTFITTACDAAVLGLVDALVVLAETAASEVERAWVGAGPLEHLLSHSGNSIGMLADVDRAARQHIAFRAALSYTWLGSDVPAPVRERLAQLGAHVLER